MPEYGIDLHNNEIYEGGATLIALLAHPTDDDGDSQRSALHRSLCHLALRARAEADRAWAVTPQPIKPGHAFVSSRELKRDLRTLGRQLRDRMIAGHMAVPFLQAASTGQQPRLPDGVKRLSINQLSEFVLSQTGQGQAENVETRIWRPSLPVIHLAAAFQVAAQIMAKNGFRAPHIGDLMLNAVLIEWIVREAQAYEPMIEKSEHFGIRPEQLVRVRLTGR